MEPEIGLEYGYLKCRVRHERGLENIDKGREKQTS
jgi:hypothetical protein